MVSVRDKKQAIDFICGLVEDSKKYLIGSRDNKSIKLKDNPTLRASPRSMEIVMANFLGKPANYKQRVLGNIEDRCYTVPLFYKDGKTAFVRMVDKNSSWRSEKSLKRYTVQEINQMITLRKIEKKLTETSNCLSFYQPRTNRLIESVRDFNLDSVVLDYSHIEPGDHGYGFVQNKISINYKIPRELSSITSGPIDFKCGRYTGKIITV
jgi:hypothetical protein